MVDGFMGSPTWESIVAGDGNNYVNVVGDIEYDNKPVKALLQFQVNEDERFQYNALEYNGMPQNALDGIGLLTAKCGEGKESSSDSNIPLDEEDIAKVEGLSAMILSDVLLDFKSLIGTKVYVRGYFSSLSSEANYLSEDEFSTNTIVINTKDLIRDDRKFLLKKCGYGCRTGFLGILREDAFFGTYMRAEKTIK